MLQPYAELEIPGSFYLSSLAAFAEHRGQGVGTRLLRACCERARSLQVAEVSLICFERNEDALRLYPHDFGAGASTFHYLRAFDIDFVKIDGSLIGSTSQRDKAIIKSVVKLCRELDIRTIAEMVETRGQAGWLERLKVDFGQGFLFGRPGPRIGPGTRRTARLHTYEHD